MYLKTSALAYLILQAAFSHIYCNF